MDYTGGGVTLDNLGTPPIIFKTKNMGLVGDGINGEYFEKKSIGDMANYMGWHVNGCQMGLSYMNYLITMVKIEKQTPGTHFFYC